MAQTSARHDVEHQFYRPNQITDRPSEEATTNIPRPRVGADGRISSTNILELAVQQSGGQPPVP